MLSLLLLAILGILFLPIVVGLLAVFGAVMLARLCFVGAWRGMSPGGRFSFCWLIAIGAALTMIMVHRPAHVIRPATVLMPHLPSHIRARHDRFPLTRRAVVATQYSMPATPITMQPPDTEPPPPELPIPAPSAAVAAAVSDTWTIEKNGGQSVPTPSAGEAIAVAETKPAENKPVEKRAAESKSAGPDESKLPDWVNEKERTEKGRRLVVVNGSFDATEEVAEQLAVAAAARLVEDDFAAHYPESRGWKPARELVRSLAVRRVHVQPVDRVTSTSGTHFRVYRGYCEVELSPAVRAELYPHWRDVIVTARLWELGDLAALLTLTAATVAAYFRLDARTAGRHRSGLRLAALTVLLGGVGAAAAFLFG